MKRFVIGAVLFALLGGACLAVSVLEGRMARAQQAVATLQYEEPDAVFADLEGYYEYGSRLPWVGSGPLNDLRARRAALQYWQGQYTELASQQADPDPAGSDNVELQLIAAHAVYRAAQAQAVDRATTLQALDSGIDAYLSVLKNAPWHETAAYNYEYLVRLRDKIADGTVKGLLPAEEGGPFGEAGGPPEDGSVRDFKIYIPFEPDEAGQPGKAGPIQRRG